MFHLLVIPAHRISLPVSLVPSSTAAHISYQFSLFFPFWPQSDRLYDSDCDVLFVLSIIDLDFRLFIIPHVVPRSSSPSDYVHSLTWSATLHYHDTPSTITTPAAPTLLAGKLNGLSHLQTLHSQSVEVYQRFCMVWIWLDVILNMNSVL